MQDFDFDEIDRAVNSTLDPATPADPKPTGESVPVSVSRSEPASQVSVPAARRSSGRFMDVVHPSSDMRSAPSPERSEPRKPEAPTPTSPPDLSSSDWPDPLDFHGFKDEPQETSEPEAPKAEESSTPLESPFLSDTKVEKRPLGAFSTEDEPKETPVEEPKKEEMPLLEASDEPLLEAENEEAPKQPEMEPTPEPAGEPTPAAVVEEEPVGPTSITQQYKEQPSTTEQPSGAIFDTEAYHQPLAHPVKKKSGALIIVWILALIVVGAGVGAGVYFYVLPAL